MRFRPGGSPAGPPSWYTHLAVPARCSSVLKTKQNAVPANRLPVMQKNQFQKATSQYYKTPETTMKKQSTNRRNRRGKHCTQREKSMQIPKNATSKQCKYQSSPWRESMTVTCLTRSCCVKGHHSIFSVRSAADASWARRSLCSDCERHTRTQYRTRDRSIRELSTGVSEHTRTQYQTGYRSIV